ncbi:hypothetical protein ACSSZE_14025 [Acidithiobacillus caldus]
MARKTQLSADEDDRLRSLVIAVMDLKQKRIADITRELKFSSGAISGWLNGGIDRLSREKKNVLAEYLGISSGKLVSGTCHIFKTTKSSVDKHLLFVVGSNNLSAKIIIKGSEDFGVLIYSKTVCVALVPALLGTNPLDLISDIPINIDGELNITSERDIYSRYISTASNFLDEQNSAAHEEAINAHYETDKKALLSWIEVFKKIAESGLTPEDVAKALGLK